MFVRMRNCANKLYRSKLCCHFLMFILIMFSNDDIFKPLPSVFHKKQNSANWNGIIYFITNIIFMLLTG